MVNGKLMVKSKKNILKSNSLILIKQTGIKCKPIIEVRANQK